MKKRKSLFICPKSGRCKHWLFHNKECHHSRPHVPDADCLDPLVLCDVLCDDWPGTKMDFREALCIELSSVVVVRDERCLDEA